MFLQGPTKVVGIEKEVKCISAGYSHSCAITGEKFETLLLLYIGRQFTTTVFTECANLILFYS